MAGMYVTSFDEAHHALADALNILRPESTWETRLTGYEVALAPTDFMIETCGLSVGKGSVAGFRYQIASFINGERWATIEVEHVAMLGLGDSWRQTVDQPEFLIRIQGRPTLEMEFGTVMDPENPNSTMGLVELNAARLVNLIPAVTSAPPGALLFGDLPAVTAIPTDRRNGGFL